jgi:hypothetical protein
MPRLRRPRTGWAGCSFVNSASANGRRPDAARRSRGSSLAKAERDPKRPAACFMAGAAVRRWGNGPASARLGASVPEPCSDTSVRRPALWGYASRSADRQLPTSSTPVTSAPARVSARLRAQPFCVPYANRMPLAVSTQHGTSQEPPMGSTLPHIPHVSNSDANVCLPGRPGDAAFAEGPD